MKLTKEQRIALELANKHLHNARAVLEGDGMADSDRAIRLAWVRIVEARSAVAGLLNGL